MRIYHSALLFLLACLLALPQSAFAAEKKSGTRDLVFEDDTPAKKDGKRDLIFEDDKMDKDADPAQQPEKQPAIKDGQKMSLTMSLELQRDGKTDIVPPNSTFKSGDRVKLIYTPSVDGYVYWLARMTSGKYTVLFPTAKTGTDNAVKKGQKYTMPAKGAFRFDDKTGTEVLMCVISPERIKDLDAAVAEADKAGGQVDLNTNKIEAIENMNLNKRQTRDLIFEEEEDEKSLTKTQTAKAGEPMIAVFELVHE